MGKVLRKARESSEISAKDAAVALDITTASLSRLETGKSSASVHRLKQMALLYKLSLIDLLNETVVPSQAPLNKELLRVCINEVHQIAKELEASPSSEKLADLIVQTYEKADMSASGKDMIAKDQRTSLELSLKP
ncbi:MAG: helix-turn-helix transcriptional regulator [Lentilitoribacter sp.]